MRRVSLAIGFAVIALPACTFLSGVEQMELRDRDRASDAGDEGSAPGAALAPTAPIPFGPSPGDAGAAAPRTGATCGAEGSWTACELTDTFASCAERCAAKGLTCVESCCVYDELGHFAARTGMVYSVPGLSCDTDSVPNTSSAGLCSDPVLPLTTGVMDVRCCCR